MGLSPVLPLGLSFERTRRLLFSPFDAKKWLVMGFAAFLAALGEGAGGGNLGRLADLQERQEVTDFIRDNLTWILTVAGGVLVVAAALGVAILWVSSRGWFVFLDNVVKDRAAIAEPWRRYAELARSLFWFRLVLSLVAFLVVAAAMGGGLALAWEDLQAETFGSGAVVGLAVVVGLILPVAILAGGILWLLRGFAVPVMYQRGLSASAALGVVWRELVRPHLGSLLVFGLLEAGLGLAAAVVMVGLTCATCCVAGLPYVSSVVFLPLAVFFRCLSLYFLAQLGPDWQIIPSLPPASAPWGGPSQFTPPPAVP